MYNNYGSKKRLDIIRYECWNTDALSETVLENYERAVEQKKYFVYDIILDESIKNSYGLTMEKHSDEFKIFLFCIINEHYQISKKSGNSSIEYLWYMYWKSKKYAPFILMSEMQLLRETGYLLEEEIVNLWKMIDSSDTDSNTMAYLALKNIRDKRVKELGNYSPSNFAYNNIEKIYTTNICNLETFKHSYVKS